MNLEFGTTTLLICTSSAPTQPAATASVIHPAEVLRPSCSFDPSPTYRLRTQSSQWLKTLSSMSPCSSWGLSCTPASSIAFVLGSCDSSFSFQLSRWTSATTLYCQKESNNHDNVGFSSSWAVSTSSNVVCSAWFLPLEKHVALGGT